MPQIAPDTWKPALEYYWFRVHQDGTIDYEFDLDTGQIHEWGAETPKDLKRAGWLPMTEDLAQKIRVCGEIGKPTASMPVAVNLKPGEELVLFRNNRVINGVHIRCRACQLSFNSMAVPDACPNCDVVPGRRCGREVKTAEDCKDCKKPCDAPLISPFVVQPHKFDETHCILGIKGKFQMKFNSTGLKA